MHTVCDLRHSFGGGVGGGGGGYIMLRSRENKGKPQ